MICSKKIGKTLLAGILSLSMLTASGLPFVPTVTEGSVAKAVVIGDEGSTGLESVDSLAVSSPDGKIKVQLWKDANGAYYYSTYLNNYVVLQCSPVGVVLSGNDLSTGFELDESSVKIVDGKDDYDIIQGPVNHVNKEYKQLEFTLKKGDSLVTMNYRVSNDGMAYRYTVDSDATSDSEAASVTSEDSSFVVPDSGTIWTNGYSNTYEGGEYTKRTIASVKSANSTYSSPILVSVGADGNNAWMLLTEASVYNNDDPYCSTVFQTKSGSKALQTKFGNKLDQEEDVSKHKTQFKQSYTGITNVNFTNVFTTSWRVAIIGEDLNAVTNSTLVTDLNPPAEGDYSWVKPGTSVWSWWSTNSDAIDYDSMRDYIDYCSEAGIEYCLVDYGWELWDDYKNKISTLVEYAGQKNVSILVWYGVHKRDAEHIFDLDNEADIEEQFAWCESVGVKGVKVDYLESDSQFAMKNMYLIASIAANHKLVVNYHGCTDPNGENRTFPNILSSEAVCGMEYFKWSDASKAPTLMILPLTRNVLGSMEYTPTLWRVPRSECTSGFMLSMCIEYESAVETFAHSGYVYPGYNGLSLAASVPSTWDESRMLQCDPGENIIRARRDGENWYIGAMTLAAKTYDVPLDFLDEGCTYHAYIYSDNEDGSNIEISSKDVTSEDSLSFDLLAQGGCAVKLTKDDPLKTTIYDNYTYYEAEDATCGGSASVKTDMAYISGMAYVQGIGSNANNTLTFNVNVPEDGTYKFKAYILSPNKKTLCIKANGGEEVKLSDIIGIAGDSNAVGDNGEYVDIELVAGDNTVVLYNTTAQAPGIDRIAISKALISDAEVTLDKSEYVCNGQICKPAVTVKRNGATLTEGKEYSVFYSNNIKAGTATVYVSGINGYGDVLAKEFSITNPATPTPQVTGVPKTQTTTAPATPATPAPSQDARLTAVKPAKVKLSAVKSLKKKQIKVSYKKLSNVSGYQIAYSIKKNFKGAKIIKVKASVTSKVIKKLKSKKKYFVRVRAYNSVNGTNTYGAWSKVKNVKVK